MRRAKTMKKKLLFLRRGHTDTTVGTLAKNEGKKLTQIHPEEALRWSRSFESLLTDKSKCCVRHDDGTTMASSWSHCVSVMSIKVRQEWKTNVRIITVAMATPMDPCTVLLSLMFSQGGDVCMRVSWQRSGFIQIFRNIILHCTMSVKTK